MDSTSRIRGAVAGLAVAATLVAAAGSAAADVPLDAAPVVTADNIYTSGETINLGSVTIPRTTDLLSSLSAAASNSHPLGDIWKAFGNAVLVPFLIAFGSSCQSAGHSCNQQGG
ncbi:hypothetical protein OHB26_00795 [Nocardia sp. NBC_01503]|uniref:hypothetical protein n=1 Tax=Nocardia sp. NBC_01503 TaxID=2975997 RepID=UPI002E7B60C3|nr:hypothetical protein [Nocardia sp. NBC_01503]WTL32835.1 hypothetical protein OHB26_00795 [Nocardia sp. NBC_01503]